MTLTKGDIWAGYRSVNIPVERKYRIAFARPYMQHRPAIQFTDHENDVVYSEVYTTEAWERLVADVNDIATLHTGQQGGVFYVNEFKQVIKPIGDSSGIVDIYVGEYPDLHFVFDCNGKLIDNADVTGLKVSSPWPHQKVGIKYHFSAYREEIFYEMPQGNVIRRPAIKVPPDLGQALWTAKGGQGGIFYVNEHGHAFAPQSDEAAGPDVFVGTIDLNQWLSKWSG